MITVELQIEIKAPPEVVFDLLADHTKHPLWDPHMIEAKLFTEGPIKKGSKGITVGELKGRRRIENEIVYDEYDRPKFVSGGTTSGSVIGKMTNEFIPTEKGTKVNFRLEVKIKGLMRLLEPFIKRTLIKKEKTRLEALNDYITKNR